jgi:ribonuclease P protein component
LTRSTDFKRVRRQGKSYAHPLLVLIALPNEREASRFGISAGRAVGKAVKRNHAKRLIREGLRPFLPLITPGWDIILLARNPMAVANLESTQKALQNLLSRAHLLLDTNDEPVPPATRIPG